MRAAIVTAAIGGWYARGLARLTESLHRQGFETDNLLAWVNTLPDTKGHQLQCPYEVKPFAMLAAKEAGYDVAVWVDCSCFAIRDPAPMFRHIAAVGHFLNSNGFKMGNWASDAALQTVGMSRAESFTVEEATTMCVGLSFTHPKGIAFLDGWIDHARKGVFVGPHANETNLETVKAKGFPRRTVGPISDHPDVWGHRHDQTSASILCHRMAMPLTPRPHFIDYDNPNPHRSTLFLSRGL
jgi:hypothetical protein